MSGGFYLEDEMRIWFLLQGSSLGVYIGLLIYGVPTFKAAGIALTSLFIVTFIVFRMTLGSWKAWKLFK